MNETTIERLHDARSAAAKARHYVGDRPVSEYLANEALNLIVERLLEIVGEALNAARRQEPILEERIPDLRVAISVRNRIIHGYDTIDHVVLWEAVTESLPKLISQIDTILESETAR
jgi:uncharacterized protein with HEPN domain